jgi:hypothetical protein
MRYLTIENIRTALNLGKAVSQWLPSRSEGEQTILRWLTLEATGGAVSVRYCEVFDAPEAGTFDVGEFPPVNPDEPEGVAEKYSTLEDALSAASARWGARADHYINASMLDSAYQTWRSRT